MCRYSVLILVRYISHGIGKHFGHDYHQPGSWRHFPEFLHVSSATKDCIWMSRSAPDILAWMQTLSLALDDTPVFQIIAYISCISYIYIYVYLFRSCILQCHVVSVCPSYLVSCSAHHQFCIHLLRSVTSSAQVWYLYDARKLFGQEAATQIRLDHC